MSSQSISPSPSLSSKSSSSSSLESSSSESDESPSSSIKLVISRALPRTGKFDYPRHVAVDKDLRYVYVADSKNSRIQKFDVNGSFIEVIGKLGNKRSEFNLPTTIEIDSKGNFLVNERGNERIQKFDSNWNPVLMWGSKGSGNSEFCRIEHIAIDKYHNVYVTDPQSDPGLNLLSFHGIK